MRDALVLCAAQCALYVLIILNTRAIVVDSMPWACAADAMIATLSFGVMHRIAKLKNGWHGYAGYLVGSVAGTVLGLNLSRMVHL